MFSTFFNPFVKIYTYTENEDIDITRYPKLMLDLIDEYKILELHVEKD